jgi:L-alanine-DL-glutamate epimerase-like enolase superfamily enzyme
MKITSVEAIPVSLPFKKPMVMSGSAVTAAHTVVVKLHTE